MTPVIPVPLKRCEISVEKKKKKNKRPAIYKDNFLTLLTARVLQCLKIYVNK